MLKIFYAAIKQNSLRWAAMTSVYKKLFFLTAFSIAMGFVETAVVIYLRELYYPLPDGFKFPLVPIPPNIAVVEFLREAATIIMLAGVGILAGRNKTEKFAFFIYCFAVWDIFYYVFLKIFLNWPESFFTWDVLFLIPVPWVGPVLAPVFVSLVMILLAGIIVFFEERNVNTKFLWKETVPITFGCFIIIFSFMMDYVEYVLGSRSETGIWNVASEKALFEEVANYVPLHFNWLMFLTGGAVLLFGIAVFFFRMKKQWRMFRSATEYH